MWSSLNGLCRSVGERGGSTASFFVLVQCSPPATSSSPPRFAYAGEVLSSGGCEWLHLPRSMPRGETRSDENEDCSSRSSASALAATIQPEAHSR